METRKRIDLWIGTLLFVAVVLSGVACRGDDIWATLYHPCTNFTFNLGETYNVCIQMELGQATWDSAEVGYGTGSDPANYTWTTAMWYEDATPPNKRVSTPIVLPTSLGTGVWYYAGRARALGTDPWTYANSCDWGNAKTLAPTNTITILPAAAASADSNMVAHLESNGMLSWTNGHSTNKVFDVVWSSGPGGAWNDAWSGLVGIRSTSTLLQVQVPVFYRVRQRSSLAALERIMLPSSGVTNTSAITLTNGHRYQIVVESYFRFNTADPNYGEYADAEYYQNNQQMWVPIGLGLGVRCNGFTLEPFSEYVDAHTYKYNLIGFGKPLKFNVYDPLNYLDNDGNLYVTIYDAEQ